MSTSSVGDEAGGVLLKLGWDKVDGRAREAGAALVLLQA